MRASVFCVVVTFLSCVYALCGDRILDANEQCDSGVGCLRDCTCMQGAVPTSPPSVNCSVLSACGNMVLDAGEQCERIGRLCTPNCTCVTGAVPTVPQSINCTLCGNGKIDADEQCELGGSDCTSSCTCLPGSFPTSPVGVNCTSALVLPRCGNNVLEAGEQCELGGFGCNSSCVCVNGTVPLSPVGVNCTVRIACGDGILQVGEQCEVGGENCLRNCTCAAGFFSTIPVSINCISVSAGCGNSVLEPGEQCELDGINCADNCTCLPGFTSTVPLSHNCLRPSSANVSLLLPCRNTTNASYACIPGLASDYLACHNALLSFERCLPGLVCNSSIGVVVPNSTQFNPCSVSTVAQCGNGLVEPGEQCESGGANCTSKCSCTSGAVTTTPFTRDCVAAPQDTVIEPVCGNGKVEGAEECEIGSTTCTNACTCVTGLVPTIPKSMHCVSVNSSNLVALCSVVNQTVFTCIENVTGHFLRCANSSTTPPAFFECPATTFCTTLGIFTASSPCTIPIGQSICGNAVLEPGEDCDSGENCSPQCGCILGTVPTFPRSTSCLRSPRADLVSDCQGLSALTCVSSLSRQFLSCAPPFSVSLQQCPVGTICSAVNFTLASPCGLSSVAMSVPSPTLLVRQALAPLSRVLFASVCGNGIVEQGEECDGGTGCTNCRCQTGFAPTGSPACQKLNLPNICGNGILEGNEECEVGGTSCSPQCTCLPPAQKTIPPTKNCVFVGTTDLGMWCAGRSGLRCVPGVVSQFLECAFPFFLGFRPCAPGTQCLIDGFSNFNPCILPSQIIILPLPPAPIPPPPTLCDRPDRECQIGGRFCGPNCFCLPGCQPFFPRTADCFTIAPPNFCGNGRVDPGEACDGGSSCQNCVCLPGSVPTVPPSASCTRCRNGQLDAGEQCDSGSLCNFNCVCSPGSIPTGGLGCTRCGNNVLDFGEECEAGGIGCSGCRCLPGFIPTFPLSRNCVLQPRCGNGIIDFGEECDSFLGCLPNCRCGPGFIPKFPPSPLCLPISICGNFIVEQGEECDGGFGCFGCRCAPGFRPFFPPVRDCFPVQVCGDGIVQGTEQCDSGFGCSACSCLPGFQPAIPPASFCVRLCGNNRVDFGEECDGGVGCTPSCTCDAALGFRPSTPPGLSCQVTCGNGIIDFGEECDSGVGCDSNCRCITATPSRFGFQPFVPPQPNCKPNCGDLRLEVPEQCDGGFGCDPNCQCRPGYKNIGSVVCLPLGCGDGVIGFGEECEPGGQGCRSWCQCDLGFIPNTPVRVDCVRVI